MHLRRALLLFAVVLGIAAVVASLSSPQRRGGLATKRGPGSAPEATPSAPPAGEPVDVEFGEGHRPQTRRLTAGRAAVVSVSVAAPGEVTIDDLGLSAAADPATPARFDVLAERPARHAVRFLPAGGGAPRLVGTLRIVRSG